MIRIQRSLLLAVLVLAAVAALPNAAQAWRHGGWGPGVYFGIIPPVIIAPPVYFAPPPPYYAPRRMQPAGEACYAGPYVCPLGQPGPLGAPCSCPTNGGRAGGRIG